MATTRATPVRKQTRKADEKTQSVMDTGVSLTLDGVDYTVRMGDLTGLDARELRRQVGMSFPQVLTALTGEGADLDMVAAVIWLARFSTKGEKNVTYEEVAASLGYDVFERIEINESTAEEAGEDPEE
jgi:hypothetical protein